MVVADGSCDVGPETFAQGFDDRAIGCNFCKAFGRYDFHRKLWSTGGTSRRNSLASDWVRTSSRRVSLAARRHLPWAIQQAIQPAIRPKKTPQKNSTQRGMSTAAKGASREKGS